MDGLVVESGVVLLLDDTPPDARGHYCEQSLAAGPASERAELRVTVPEPGEGIGIHGGSGRQPAKRGVVAVSDSVEARRIAAEDTDFSEPVITDAVVDRTDLRDLAVTVSRYCEVLSEGGYDITVCVDGLTDLLAANDSEYVFQFAHVLSQRLDAVDAVAHFHLDPTAHEEAVVRTFEDVFDGVFVEIEPDESTLDTADRTRATDAEVARLADDDASASTDADAEATPRTNAGAEATDDDIAEALEDS